VFPQRALLENGVISSGGKGGKRALRVYPPWVAARVDAAIRTQRWQLRYFFPIAEDGSADPVLVRRLFSTVSPG
jgi:hypothetical protein